MKEDQTNLNAQESLRVIREAIDLAKNTIREDGFHFLLWGWLVVISSAADWYLAVIMRHSDHSKVWLLMVAVGVPAALIREWRKSRKSPVNSIVREWYGLVWFAYLAVMVILIAAATTKGLSPVPFILAVTALATFISGVMLKFRPLIFGSIMLWAGGLWCVFLAPEHHLIVQAVAAVLGYLVPGYLLNQAVDHHVSRT